jgi:hypothetical protein
MRSPAESGPVRIWLERGARALALLVLVLLLILSHRPDSGAGYTRSDAVALTGALRTATLEWRDAGIALYLDSIPGPRERHWLSALRGAGIPVQWTSNALEPAALRIDHVPDPRGGLEVQLWRGSESPAVVRDGAGELARLDAGAGATSISTRSVVGAAEVLLPRQRASAELPAALRLGSVVVLGRAGWESRFLLRSLEELGWAVDARLFVAPGVTVQQGTVARIDTAAYALVIVLDSSAAPYAAAVARFVESGGGLVLAGEGARVAAFSRLGAGRAGTRQRGSDESLPTGNPRLGLGFYPIVAPASDAAVLQRHGSHAAVAARRLGAGRVVQMSYDESWRWRMEGGDEGPEAHRDWWGRIIAAAAYAPIAASPDQASGAREVDPSPLSSLVQHLGPASAHADVPLRPREWPVGALLAAALLLLLAEWASRRLRGAA